MVSKKVGVQLHIDLLKKSSTEKPVIVKKGTDAGVQSSLNHRIKETGTYYIRVYDRGMDNETKGFFSGYTLYVSKQ